ncbi:hypothetical protein M0802_013126 [Mischocyttarus mexicanus]|nr:hypothetical protein M0802_013126 [Mischocyttarus mexicanus]
MQENGQAAFGRLKEEAGRRRGKGVEGGDLCEEMGKMKGVSFCSTEREVWYEGARRAIEARIRAATNSNGAGSGGGGVGGGGNIPPSAVARGVVLFVGDGMGMSTLTAARILSGQRHGNTGEEAQLAWDSFPAVALSRDDGSGVGLVVANITKKKTNFHFVSSLEACIILIDFENIDPTTECVNDLTHFR